MTFGLFTFKLTDWTTQIHMAKNLFDFNFTQMVILPYVSHFSHCYSKSHLYKEEDFWSQFKECHPSSLQGSHEGTDDRSHGLCSQEVEWSAAELPIKPQDPPL